MKIYDLIALFALAAVVYGCYIIYAPLGWIVGGLVVFVLAEIRTIQKMGGDSS